MTSNVFYSTYSDINWGRYNETKSQAFKHSVKNIKFEEPQDLHATVQSMNRYFTFSTRYSNVR